ncbi:unnamed protein product [Paramecium pentaurelia]|uniref:Transmembrane protein n=1 Tax=Paramecium pentaurelia TaxID=43138 RepID=A0A8S1TL61_9CILI|nr:unnamed protein product [Paramecium pentaurelia]
MLNKYTLEFLFKDQAEQYENYSKQSKLREVTYFTIYSVSFCILNTTKFILRDSIPYSILSGISIIIILILWKILQRKPHLINLIVTIYQVFLLCAFKIPQLFEGTSNPTLDQSWYYGFQCGYLHFNVYLLSANFIYQTFLLIVIIGVHLYQDNIDIKDGIINIFLFVFLAMNMIAIKYNYEKTKKEQYFQSCQQEKWEQLLSKVLSSSILLVSHDKKQDQLQLEKENKFSSILFRLKDGENLRQLLRQLIVTSSNDPEDSVSNLIHINMEKTLRRFLIHTQEFADTFKTYKYTVQHQQTQKFYNVKILRCVFNNKLQCLLIIDPKKKYFYNQTQVLWSILQNITETANEQSSFLIKMITKFNQISIKQRFPYQKFYFNHNFIQNIQIIFQHKSNSLKLTDITQVSLQTVLDPLIGLDSQNLILKKSFTHDITIIQQLLISCFYIIQHIFKDVKILQILIENQNNEIFFSIKIKEKDKIIQTKILEILQTNWVKSPKGFFHKNTIHQSLLERISYLTQQFQIPINLLLNISITQLILSKFGVYNHLDIIQANNEFTFKFSLVPQIQ